MKYCLTRKRIAKELRILLSASGVSQVIWEPIIEDLLATKETTGDCLVCRSDTRGMSFCPECLTQKGKESKVGFEFEDLLDEVERSTKDGTNPTFQKPTEIAKIERIHEGESLLTYLNFMRIKLNLVIDQVNKLSEKN